MEDEDLPKGAVAGQRFVQERRRIDFSFQVKVLDIEVEKKAIKTAAGEQRLMTGSLNSVGPAKMRVTWNFLAHMTMLVSQYAMPMHRFARLVWTSVKRFTAAEMSRYYQFVARHFAPVYNQLGKTLAQAPVLSGDDTSSLVLQVSRHQSAAGDSDPPWQDYSTVARAQSRPAQAHPSLGCMIGSVWPFVSARKDGKGNKTSLNTSVVIGRAFPPFFARCVM